MNTFSKVLVGVAKVAPVFSIAAAVAGIGFGIHEARQKRAYREAKLRILRGEADVADIVDAIDEADVVKDE